MATNDVLVRRGGREKGLRPVRGGSPGTIVALGVTLTACATAAQTLLYVIGHFVLGASLFDADAAASFETAAGTAAVAICAVSAAALAVARPGERALPGGLAALVTYFAIDKAVGVHERLGESILDGLGVTSVSPSAVWLVLYAPVVALGALLILRLQRDGPPAPRLATRVGVLALGGALVVQAAWILLRRVTETGGDAHVLTVAIEEGLELAGWLLIATGLAAATVALPRPRPRRGRL